MSEALSVCGCFIIPMFIIIGIPIILECFSPDLFRESNTEEYWANHKMQRDKIKELEYKARQGDLIAYREWKELTGRY